MADRAFCQLPLFLTYSAMRPLIVHILMMEFASMRIKPSSLHRNKLFETQMLSRNQLMLILFTQSYRARPTILPCAASVQIMIGIITTLMTWLHSNFCWICNVSIARDHFCAYWSRGSDVCMSYSKLFMCSVKIFPPPISVWVPPGYQALKSLC